MTKTNEDRHPDNDDHFLAGVADRLAALPAPPDGDEPPRWFGAFTVLTLGSWTFAVDPVAADTMGATLMGFDPERIPYIAEAGRFLGQTDRDRDRLRPAVADTRSRYDQRQ